MKKPTCAVPGAETHPSGGATPAAHAWFPALRLSHSSEFFLHEIAAVEHAHGRLEAELQHFLQQPDLQPWWSFLARLARSHHRHFIAVETALACVGVTWGGPRAGDDAPVAEAERSPAPTAHGAAHRAAALAALRRSGLAMDAACDAALESATLLGFADLAEELSAWGASWKAMDPRLRQETRRAALEAYLADTFPSP